jgi:hypothetical protein
MCLCLPRIALSRCAVSSAWLTRSLWGWGAMLGAGVFAAFGPAAAAAGAGLLLALAVAAVVAYCNATSSAELADAASTGWRRHLAPALLPADTPPRGALAGH